MNILGILKTIGKDFLAVENTPIGRSLTTGVVAMIAPEAIPFTNLAFNLINSSQAAVAKSEVLFKDKTGSSAQKAAEAQDAVIADLQAIRDGFAEFGYDMTIPADEVKKLNDLTLAMLDQVNVLKNGITVTKKAAPAPAAPPAAPHP